MAIKKSNQRILVEKILAKKGVSYQKWSKDSLVDSSMRLLKDTDQALKDLVLEQAEKELIIEYVNNNGGI